MNLTVNLFAAAREITGQSSVTVELADNATVADVRTALARLYPSLSKLITRSAIALNQDYANDTQAVLPGEEIALIPPVSGG